jgi:hypothetical protein
MHDFALTFPAVLTDPGCHARFTTAGRIALVQ